MRADYPVKCLHRIPLSPGTSQAPPLGSSHVDATCAHVGQETRPLPCAASARRFSQHKLVMHNLPRKQKRNLNFHQPEAGLEPVRIPNDTAFIEPMQ